MKMKLYKSLPQITKAIDALRVNGAALEAEAHLIACSALNHVIECGDVRGIGVVVSMLEAMPKMARVNGLRAWFEKFGPITFEGNVPFYDRTKRETSNLAGAMVKPFWQFAVAEGKPYESPNPAKVMEALIKRLEHDQKRTDNDWSLTIQALKMVPVAVKAAQQQLAITAH